AYSTLTRWVREAELRTPPRRAGTYTFAPGEEMQHDTSPHRLRLADKTLTAQCAALALAYSRRLFIRYYPRFTRFEAKAFLAAAFAFMDGTCGRCIIDNTSVLVALGAGPEAIMAPEMRAFAHAYGVTLRAHRVGHADRKAVAERNFHYIENNFLAGRTFESFDDLNAQALAWCHAVANSKPKRTLGMSPEAAYVLEKPHLQPLPAHRPPVYECLERVVDVVGYVTLETV
ncbi:MAG: IS21 family transposase, partial [Gammaproteobacteria bacterium]